MTVVMFWIRTVIRSYIRYLNSKIDCNSEDGVGGKLKSYATGLVQFVMIIVIQYKRKA